MERLTVSQIVEATEGRPGEEVPLTDRVQGVSTDSRTLKAGEVFFALKGARYNGHVFVPDALRKGAITAVVSKSCGPKAIMVGDTLRALGDLAHYYRRGLPLQTVGVTGTNGKTTTKELIAAVLSAKFRVKKTEGNLNNLIGLPLSVFQLSAHDEVGVLEMGASRIGEIKRLSEIAEPKVGVVTNVGSAHLEFFGSVEKVAQAKSELTDSLQEGGYAVLNGDDPYCSRMGRGAQVSTFGLGESCQVRGEEVEWNENGMSFSVDGVAFRVPLLGLPNVYNCLAAISVGRIFGIKVDAMVKPLHTTSPLPMRLESIRIGEVLILNDAYNSNPSSAASSLLVLSRLKGRRVAILGDMLELGPNSEALHRELGEKVAGLAIDHLFTVGERAEHIAKGAAAKGMRTVERFSETGAVLQHLKGFAQPGDVYLVKGSRGMRMEQIVEGMTTQLSPKSESRNPKQIQTLRSA